MRWEIYGGTNLFNLKEKKENNLSDQKDKTREEQKPLVCALLPPVLHSFSLPLKKSPNPPEWLSSNRAKHKWPKEFQCNGCDIRIQFGQFLKKATMKCTLDNFMMTCRILGCFYLFIVVIVTYILLQQQFLPSNMTPVQVIC